MSDMTHQYELAYHVTPDVDEAGMQEIRLSLDQLLTSHGAIITLAHEPEKTRLSYDVRGERTSWFGYFHFTLNDKAALVPIEEQLKLTTQIMRYIILRLEPETKRRTTPRAMAQSKDDMAKHTKETPAASTQQMEQQVDQVIENI